MQHELIGYTMINDERGKPYNDDYSIPLLDLLRLLKGENLYKNTAHCEVHGHLIGCGRTSVQLWKGSGRQRITHLRMILHGGMV